MKGAGKEVVQRKWGGRSLQGEKKRQGKAKKVRKMFKNAETNWEQEATLLDA